LKDTGIGIKPEDIEKLFEDYTQLDSGADCRAEGTGLGLSISKKLAEMMDGGISVESEYGSGSCFTVQIMQEQAGTDTIGDETASNLRGGGNTWLSLRKKKLRMCLLPAPKYWQ
jgi:K+-sensing histidine kinase KdpD